MGEDPNMRKTICIGFIVSLFAIALCVAAMPAHGATAAESKAPYAVLNYDRDEKSRDLTLELKIMQGDTIKDSFKKVVPGGVDKWADFDKWYEELFALTYLSDDTKRLWKQLRSHTALFAKDFMDEKMVGALEGCRLLVVVDKEYPFPADVFRFGNKWLFEIVPIVHSLSGGDKDVSDSYKYASALVLDCQGPKDREGKEAPTVDANLNKLPGVSHKLLITLTPDVAMKALEENQADVLHLATHAEPKSFYPGRVKPAITTEKLGALSTRYRTVLSTGCFSGSPHFAKALLGDDTRFYIASMYTTSGKDGIVFADAFYSLLFSGTSPFDAFYKVKQRITGSKSDFPDILRFIFWVK